MLFAFFLSLDPRIVNLTNFFTVEFFPFLSVKFFDEFLNLFKRDKINESITNIAIIVKVYRQVEKIKLVSKASIYQTQHLLFRIFVRYVSNHKGHPSLRLNLAKLDSVFFVIFNPILLSLLLGSDISFSLCLDSPFVFP